LRAREKRRPGKNSFFLIIGAKGREIIRLCIAKRPGHTSKSGSRTGKFIARRGGAYVKL